VLSVVSIGLDLHYTHIYYYILFSSQEVVTEGVYGIIIDAMRSNVGKVVPLGQRKHQGTETVTMLMLDDMMMLMIQCNGAALRAS